MLAALLPILGPLLGKLLESVIPDPQARQKELDRMLGALAQSDLSQLEVNKAEAQSGSLFKGGWRPAVGWTCALALFYQFIGVPVAMWGFYAAGIPIPAPPKLDGVLMELLFAMLGIGGLRTIEKLKGKA